MSSIALHYHDDGANRQAQAALAMFQLYMCDGIEASWSDQWKRYEADVHVARWENCREQGYVLMLRTNDYKKQLNIAFFEHRNVDSLCAVMWEEVTMNSPTIDSANFNGKYDDKYSSDFDVKFGEVDKMGKWLFEQFETFWKESATVVDTQ